MFGMHNGKFGDKKIIHDLLKIDLLLVLFILYFAERMALAPLSVLCFGQ